MKKIALILLATSMSGTLMAQTDLHALGQRDQQSTPPRSDIATPSQDKTDGIDANIVIAKNLGPSITNLYVIDNGWPVTGPSDTTFGGPLSVGVQFRPTVNCHAKTLSAAITFYEGSAKKLRLGIYTSNLGAVGTLIQDGSTTTIPNFGTCCQLAKVALSGTGAALTAGTDYFLVATVDATTPDAGLFWDFVPPAGGGANGQSFNFGAGWDAQWTYYAAYQVQGSNP